MLPLLRALRPRRRRCSSAMAKVDANATPEHAATLNVLPPAERRARPARRAAAVRPGRRRGRSSTWFRSRPRPDLPRRPVDPHPGAAARPHARGRRLVRDGQVEPPRPHGRQPRPRGRGLIAFEAEDKARACSASRPREIGDPRRATPLTAGPAVEQARLSWARAAADGRRHRVPATAGSRRIGGARLHRARRHPRARHGRRRASTSGSRSTRQRRAGSRRRPPRRPAAGRARRLLVHRRRDRRHRSSASNLPSDGLVARRRRARRDGRRAARPRRASMPARTMPTAR